MIRMTRMADYGIMLLTRFAREPRKIARSARELAHEARLPLPTVSKILKLLARNGILQTRRGAHGGFALCRRPEEVTVEDIITALEGPVSLTQCNIHGPRKCSIERLCIVRTNWRRINHAVLEALRKITLAEMARPTLPAVTA